MKTIRYGDYGEEVIVLQSHLKELNFYNFDVLNGLFDKETEKAVKEFQKANSLTVDGIVGPKTWAKIEKKPAEEKKLFVSEYGYVPDDGIPTVENKPVILSIPSGAKITLPAVVAMNLYQQLEKWIKG